MRRSFAILAAAAGAALLSSLAAAQKPSLEGPGWTGLTNPKEIIEARESLMMAIERIMQPIDTLEVEPEDPHEITTAATEVSQLLLALPHLFPPTTNLYDPKAAQPETLALPAIWTTFPTFQQLAANAQAMAAKLSNTWDPKQQRDEADALRDTCEACHALYLRPFHESKVSARDLNFDFDSVFEKGK